MIVKILSGVFARANSFSATISSCTMVLTRCMLSRISRRVKRMFRKKTRCDLISAITNPVQDCQELGPSAKRVSVDRSEVVLQRADSNQTTQNSFEMLTKKVEALSKQVEEWSYTTVHTLDLMDSRLRSIRNLAFDCRRVCRTGSQDVPVSSAGA